MKILTLIGALLFVGVSSFADDLVLKPDIKFWLEGRTDLINSSVVTTSATTGQQSGSLQEQDFQCNNVRPNILGHVTDKITYGVRAQLCNTAATQLRDKSTSLLDWAYIDDHMFDNFTLRMGKMPIFEQNAWESSHLPQNIFAYSAAFLNNFAAYNYFHTGAQAIYKLGDNEFKVNVTTPTQAITDNSGSYQTNYGLSYGFSYKGSFLDSLIMPVVSYTVYNTDGNAAAASPTISVTNTLFAAGIRSRPMNGLKLELNYDNLNQPWNSANTSGNPAVTTSWNLRAWYIINSKLTPFVNGIMDSYATSPSSSQYTDKWIEGGLWYYPYDNTDFRYELVYSSGSQTNDPTAANSSQQTNKVYLGFAFDIGGDPIQYFEGQDDRRI